MEKTMDTNMDAVCDIAICGAGPVGMALAALLASRGMAPARIAVIDAKTLDQAAADPRSIALSYGSRQILETIGAWPLPATAIHEIHVSRRGRFGRSLIDRAEHGLPALGYVARYGDLVATIGAACQRLNVTMLRPARLLAHEERPDDVQLTLAHGDDGSGGVRRLRAALMVRAEGGLFADQPDTPERIHKRDYGQTALIAQVRTSAPIAHRAYERFTDEGPLALLPQGGDYAMVWCVRPETADNLLALGDAAFLARLEQTFGGRLGNFVAATPRMAYRLGLNAGAVDGQRTVAIGNAAQTLHPVAGQGLNLGLRDAAVLARLLARGVTPAALAEFAAQRKQDRRLTVGLTDTMARVFAGQAPLQSLLGVSLAAIDMAAPARNLLAELMMFGRR
jgi:2-octaprenyl-6-methoxyphenol hydroxylase